MKYQLKPFKMANIKTNNIAIVGGVTVRKKPSPTVDRSTVVTYFHFYEKQ